MSNIIARAMLAVGSAPAAILLYRLAYWQKRTKYEHEGKTWVVMTREQWRDETGLSEKQHRLALALLREKGFVEHKRRLHFGIQKAWIRLSETGLQALVKRPKGPEHGAQKGPTETPQKALPSGPTGPYGNALEGPIICREIEHGDKKELYSVPKDAGGATDMKKTRTVEEILAKGLGKKFSPKDNTVTDLEFRWKIRVSDVTGDYVPPLTMKQKGQLKLFLDKCPKGEAGLILETTVDNWIAFSKRVGSDSGVKKTPNKPNIDFLLKYVGTAVSFTRDLSKTTEQEASVVMPKQTVQLIAKPETSSPAPVDVKPTTMDELNALLSEDDDD